MSSVDRDSGGKEMPQIKSSWEGKREKKSQMALTDPLSAATRFVD